MEYVGAATRHLFVTHTHTERAHLSKISDLLGAVNPVEKEQLGELAWRLS